MALIAKQTLRSNIIIIKLVSDEIEIDKIKIRSRLLEDVFIHGEFDKHLSKYD